MRGKSAYEEPPEVACSSCGLLAFRHPETGAATEATAIERLDGVKRHFTPNGVESHRHGQPACLAGFNAFTAKNSGEVLFQLSRGIRCPHFTPYIEGLSPIDTWRNVKQDQLTRELEAKVESRHWQNILVCSLVAIVGFLGSIVAAVITVLATQKA